MRQPSPLNTIIQADVKEITESILKDTINPWIFFNSQGVRILKADGSYISISGVEYSGSSILVFWDGFIDAYIYKKSRELIESTRLKAIDRNIPVDIALRECWVHLQAMITTIFNRMAVVDQKLRGKGYPASVKKNNVQKYIARNSKKIEVLINAEIECNFPDKSQKSTWLDAFELKPNFWGLGINLNWLISKVFRNR